MAIELERKIIEGIEIRCSKCDYVWFYKKGIPKYRTHCPKCNSTKNNVNQELFGKWHPEVK